MAMPHAKGQSGFSLIELVVASAIGLVALSVVGSVYVKGQQFASSRSQQLMLVQDMNDTLRMLKHDIQRAGYQVGANSSFVISGATKTIHLSQLSGGVATCLSYGYADGTEQHYRSYYLSGDMLRVFSTKSSVMDTSGACTHGHAALDDRQLKVTHFSVEESQLSGPSVASQFLTINLAVATRDDTLSAARSTQVKIRNWN
ncbi:prepilin-type cleavage/methylation domain-containing protein [Photobacterium sanctipauli]|uniref:Prepilin-type cleavage/methylation domain-containing protein n=1 Tax=Photobacterium sanctipauli TaxID=1342794 RepID=A0A2T3NRJ0_9GAMM|nr:prepilin-type N-terminal cleavage/methylation domain-containing protein [Photobacterium sanctipauli]PSW18894.1 prepilin-type cleavage/methylation domain-containing protein [Photobacterium sanctipauli]